MAKHDVFANGRSIIHKGSGDKAVASAPDVCKTPVGPSVVPIPYPNISQSSTLQKGSKSVKINGQPATLKNSNFSSSNGDQAGSLGGIISGTTGNKIGFISSSFDVKIEGQNVVRHMDMTTHNKGNTIGMTYGSTAPAGGPFDDLVEKCPYCKKAEHPFADKQGDHVGNSQALRSNIISKIEDHIWYTGPNALQAHHLICSESMKDDDWAQWCTDFGYDINHKNNGVMLPYRMKLACQLHVPLHRSNHSAGKAEGMSYPDKIKMDLREIGESIKAGKYCDKPKALIEKLDRYSIRVLGKIDAFRWTITADGQDYKPEGNGCAGVNSMTGKPNTNCPQNRAHGKTRKDDTEALPRKTQQLQIGK